MDKYEFLQGMAGTLGPKAFAALSAFTFLYAMADSLMAMDIRLSLGIVTAITAISIVFIIFAKIPIKPKQESE